MYLDEKGGEGSLMDVYVLEHIVSLLDGCLRNLVGMKYSWPRTFV